jgi:hypothetical protein
MTGTSGSAPREHPHIPGATLSLITVAFYELRRDLQQLLDSNWDEPVRRRAEELSQALVLVCQRQGLDTLRMLLRSTGHLVRLSRTDAIPLLTALREKFGSLVREMVLGLPKRSDRFRG